MKIKVNGKIVRVEAGSTILEAVKEEGLEIPSLCSHPDVCTKGSCRVCMVQVKSAGYVPACATKVEERMEVITHNPELEKIRRINLELLFSQHKEECHDCVWNPGCKLLSLARKYFVKINRFDDRKDDYPELNFGGVIDFDSSKCIDCRECLEVCPVNFLEMEGRSHMTEIVPSKDRNCIYCGQCINHCPAGAFESVGEFEAIEDPFSEDKDVIFQIAPAARVSISEEFDMKPGTVSTGKLIAGLKKIGAEKVYDVAMGADFTTKLEAEEFLEKNDEELPMFTSCCPSWVRFIEAYYPEFVDNLTTVRSPHMIMGGVIKSLSNNDPVVVSVMPCTSKKYEIKRVKGEKPVDYVLTVREVGRLLRDKGVDFKNLDSLNFDNPFGKGSGDGVTYGVSGGVMEAALKEAYKIKTGEKLKDKNLKDKDSFSFDLDGKEINTLKVSGIKNAKKVLDKLKRNPNLYDYVEFMACRGGCIGGGGQPVPTGPKIREARRKGLKKAGSKKEVESSFENEEMVEILEEVKDHDLFFTSFERIEKSENIDTN